MEIFVGILGMMGNFENSPSLMFFALQRCCKLRHSGKEYSKGTCISNYVLDSDVGSGGRCSEVLPIRNQLREHFEDFVSCEGNVLHGDRSLVSTPEVI
uniref:Uncharacterized protein n=1 Tax=Vespula pensylvanica TaxID=30213 RepID=A0A834P2L4_VESPE|nr:hypothetical protein H0235_008185 [Vespula pensylvanica]